MPLGKFHWTIHEGIAILFTKANLQSIYLKVYNSSVRLKNFLYSVLCSFWILLVTVGRNICRLLHLNSYKYMYLKYIKCFLWYTRSLWKFMHWPFQDLYSFKTTDRLRYPVVREADLKSLNLPWVQSLLSSMSLYVGKSPMS